LQIDALGPVDCRIEFVRCEKPAATAIDHISKTVAIKVRESRNRIAADLTLRENALIDAVVIPAIMRRHLIRPRGYSRVRLSREERHGPFVVAWTLSGIPCSGISGSIIKQIELRIVGVPAPCRAAAQFPLFVFPRLQT